MELRIPTDVETAALGELSRMLPGHGFDGVGVAGKTLGTKLPTADPKPDLFGRVFTTGGTGRDLVTDSPTLIIEGYAIKEQQARDLCAVMVAIIEAACRAGRLGPATAYLARLMSLPANLPHPQVPDRFRFTATLSVDLRRVTG